MAKDFDHHKPSGSHEYRNDQRLLQTTLTGVTLRAQDARPGDLFAALPGTRAHGASYAAQAVNAGAVAILTDPAFADA